MLSLFARRASLAALFALTVVSSPTAAQNRRADVKRFQWNPVAIHVAAEAQLGVEIYMSVRSDNWALTWFDTDSLKAWLPQVHALEASTAASDSTAWLSGRDDSRMRVVKGVVQGHELIALELKANPSKLKIGAWLPPAYAGDFIKALDKSLSVAKEVSAASPLKNSQTVFEEWDVDVKPKGAADEHFGASLPEYALRGNVVVGFVVDTAGHVVAPTVTVYECNDANIAKQWEREVAAWRFVAGSRGGQHVPTRTRLAFTYDTGGSLQVNNDRLLPGQRSTP
ncbi:MAG TPA: hypothetical protein VGO46_07075 [Gemmatimonadaceae bacterium]|nr:hypothetical protein [Gemmatimonadaceae bacterium]